jgi:hypothetical protein
LLPLQLSLFQKEHTFQRMSLLSKDLHSLLCYSEFVSMGT